MTFTSTPFDHLLGSIAHASWFAALGEALTDSERADIAAYRQGLGLEDAAVAPVKDWHQALAVANDPEWDARWWVAEERARAALMDAAERSGTPALLDHLSDAAMRAHAATIGPAAMAAARAGVADQAAIRAAAGAATQACYQGALATLAGAPPEHPFAAKLRLFQSGRWLLGILRGAVYIF